VTSLLFVIVHLAWQQFLPLAIVAVTLGVLRWRSGSIIPAMLLHMGYNSVPFIAEVSLPDVDIIPASWAIGGAAVAGLALGAIVLVCRGARASAARDEEL
jgi:membrane protease YdiL (CAAX protease family)